MQKNNIQGNSKRQKKYKKVTDPKRIFLGYEDLPVA